MLQSIKSKVKQNVALLAAPYLPHQVFNFQFSGSMIIEPTNACNLRCPLCPTSQAMRRKKGFLSLESFKSVVDEIADMTKSISMNFAGEPLLNRDIFKMASYAEGRGISTLISTNTTFLNKYINEVFDSELSSLVVCLDGASKETHEHYRVGSNFEEIRENIRRVCEEKHRRKLAKPHITLQFIVMKHNEHEIDEIIRLSRSLGIESLDLKTVSLGSWIGMDRKSKLAKEYLPSNQEFSRFEIKDGIPQVKKRPKFCSWLGRSVILWNGDVTICCYDFNGELVVGNIFRDGGFRKIWESKKMKQTRKLVINRSFELCKRCNLTGEYGKTILVKNV